MIYLLILRIKKIFFILFSFKKIIYKCFFLNFIAPSIEHKPILRYIGEIDNLIDVGFNHGQFILFILFYKKINNIHCFDPLPESNKIYKKYFLRKINFYNYCLGNENKITTFNITSKKDSSSILNPKTQKVIKKLDTHIVCFKNLNIDLGRKKKTLLKLDIQGYEYQALEGFAEMINLIDYVIIEMSFEQQYDNQILEDTINSYLLSIGYIKVIEYNVSFKNQIKIQSDILYRRS